MCVMAQAETTRNGVESSRSDSIGSYDAYKELQEVSSVELLRSSILRSIPKKQTSVKLPDKAVQYGPRSALKTDFSDLSVSNVEVNFLERCSSLNSHLHTVKKTDARQVQRQTSLPVQITPDDANISNPVLHLLNSNFCETPDDIPNLDEESLERTPIIYNDASEDPKIKVPSKNGLKLAFRASRNTIFEDCSTYNIHCGEVSLPNTNNFYAKEKNFTNSKSCNSTEIDFYNREQLGKGNYHSREIQNSLVKSIQNTEATDDQTSLCDTFFSTVINDDSAPILANSLPKLTNKGQISTKAERTESIVSKGQEGDQDTDDGDVDNIRIRRRIRKRNRKNKSKEPHVYECPKCGVSYTISTNMVNDTACCLHCDLWTSVEPEFLKREKQPWNTCRIC